MALTINTNLASMIVQSNLESATAALNKSIERMTTGYRINSAADDAAGYAVATKMDTKLSSIDVCQDNVAMGSSLLSTLSSNYDLITTHLQRIRDLTEEAANGTYGTDSLDAIKAEIGARWDEIDRIAASTEFNGIVLTNGSQGTNGISIRCGVGTAADVDTITLAATLFKSATAKDLQTSGTALDRAGYIGKIDGTAASANAALTQVDAALKEVTTRQTNIGAFQNRLDSAAEALDVQYSNMTASLSTVKDADVAEESSAYIKSQILQQASATLLSTANQAPSIALNLI